MIGLHQREGADRARAWIDEFGWDFPVVDDPEGSIAGSLGVYGHPVKVVLDAGGRVAATAYGAGDAAAWDDLIAAATSRTAGATASS